MKHTLITIHGVRQLALVLGGVVLLLFFSHLHSILLPAFLTERAAATIDSQLARHTAVFATLSAMKGVVGVVEGSTLGLSFGASLAIELGDLVEPAYDFIDVTWHLFLPALFVLLKKDQRRYFLWGHFLRTECRLRC